MAVLARDVPSPYQSQHWCLAGRGIVPVRTERGNRGNRVNSSICRIRRVEPAWAANKRHQMTWRVTFGAP